MRLILLFSELFEAPISDIYLHGSKDASYRPRPNAPFSTGTSFSQTDQKVLQSEKGRAKIINAFNRTPFDFQIYFINNNQADAETRSGNSLVDDFAMNSRSGIYKNYSGGINASPDKITVVLLTNLSVIDQKMPMTAWTLAHKIGHCLQDHYYDVSGRDSFSRQIRRIIIQCRVVLHKNKSKSWKKMPSANSRISRLKPFLVKDLANKVTTKSARDGKLNNPFEVFAEIIAQYLISGAVKLSVETPEAQEELKKLNEIITELFEMLVGFVLIG